VGVQDLAPNVKLIGKKCSNFSIFTNLSCFLAFFIISSKSSTRSPERKLSFLHAFSVNMYVTLLQRGSFRLLQADWCI